MKCMKLAAGAAALSLLGLPVAEARTVSAACASASEISAIQVASVQQELTDAALACGPKAVALFNQFQTVFNKELRKSDATMLKMFKRMNGNRAGDAAYDCSRPAPLPMPSSAVPSRAPTTISAARRKSSSLRRSRPTSRCWKTSCPACR